MCLRPLHMLRFLYYEFFIVPTRSPPVASHRSPRTMHRSALLLVVLAASPLATTASVLFDSDCIGGVYTANSTYEANLRRLAAILPAETASSQDLRAFRGVGYWPPNRVRAFSYCYGGWGASSSSCAACVADAFQEAESACPYGKKVDVYGSNCSLSLADFPIFGPGSWFELVGAGLVFQAIGFGWLFFLLLQEWRDKRRGSMMRSSSIPSGDNLLTHF